MPCPACRHVLARPPERWDGVCDCGGCGRTLLLTVDRHEDGGGLRFTEWHAELSDPDDVPDDGDYAVVVGHVEAAGVPVGHARAGASVALLAGLAAGLLLGADVGPWWVQVAAIAAMGGCINWLALDVWRRRGR